MSCSIEDCGAGPVVARGLCRRHYNAVWRDENREALRAYQQQWRAENPELERAKKQRHRASGRENVTNRIRYAANLRPICRSCNARKGGRWFGIARLRELIAFVSGADTRALVEV